MPIIKTKRTDPVMRSFEVDAMLRKAEGGVGNYRGVTVRFNPKMVRCLIAMLWIWGKRITENLKVRRGDVFVREGHLYVRFTVLKKKGRKARPYPVKVAKYITLKNPYARYVVEWVDQFKNPNNHIFPGHVRARTIKVKDKITGKVYTYHREAEARMSREQAYRIIKSINSKAWLHLFRHSLATEMAERGSTEEELMNWFDWSRTDTAHRYVKGGPKLTEKWAERTW